MTEMPLFLDLRTEPHVRPEILQFEITLKVAYAFPHVRFSSTLFSGIEHAATVASNIVYLRDEAREALERSHRMRGFFVGSWSEYVRLPTGDRPHTAITITLLHDLRYGSIVDLFAFDLAGEQPMHRVMVQLNDQLLKGRRLIGSAKFPTESVLHADALRNEVRGAFKSAMCADEYVTCIPLMKPSARADRRSRAH